MASQESRANLSNDTSSKSHKKHKNKKDKKGGVKQSQTRQPEAQIKQEPVSQIKQEPQQQVNLKPAAEISQEPSTQSIQEPAQQKNQEPSTQVNLEAPIQVSQEPPTQVNQEPPSQVNQEPPTLVNQEPPTLVYQEPPTLVYQEPPTQVNQGPPSQVNQEPPTLVNQEPPTQINQEPPTQVNQEPPTLVNQEPPTQINQEPPTQVNQEPPTLVNQEPPTQVNQEPPTQVNQESPTQVNQDPPTQVNQEPPTQVNQEISTQVNQKPVPMVSQEPISLVNQEPKAQIKQDSEITNKGSCTDIEDDDDDLSELQIASSLLDQTYALDDPEFDVSEGNSNEAYKNIMGLCSSTTENIKKSIYEILNSRENVNVTEEDTTTVLQESLNQKMADFNKVISGCLESDHAQASTSESIEQVGTDYAEVLEIKEELLDESLAVTGDGKVLDSEKASIDDAEKPSAMSSDLNSEEQSKSDLGKTPKNKSDKTAKNNEKKGKEDTSTVATKPDDLSGKGNVKATKVSEKKSDMDSSCTKPTLSQARETVKEAIRYSISPDDERINRKRNGSTKKRPERTVDQVLRSLGNGPAEEKLQLLCKKHIEALEEFRLMEPRIKQLERQYIVQQREKESSQAELNRMILAKSRLESLCREMQRQSRAIKDESLLRIREEEEKRKEVANKFQATLNDISSLMQENSKKNIQLREENAQLATKLKGLVDNYEIWEQNMTKVVQQKELETQLAKAKHAKVNLLLKQETEKFLREKQSLLENLSELQKRCTVLTSNELQLRTELSDYTSKYEEFQSVLTNSSKVFSTFKNDMETTSKKIKKLEKETNVYKQKWESSNKALLDMISHKDKQDKDFSNAQQRISTLEKLCRALQAERNDLRNQLNLNSSNPAPANTSDVPPLVTE